MLTVRMDRWPKLIANDNLSEVRQLVGGISGVKCTVDEVVMPLETRLLELIVSKLDMSLSPEARTWYEQEMSKEDWQAYLANIEDIEISHEHGRDLWPFQRVGAHFASRHGNIMLCPDCGLGKTATAVVGAELARWHSHNLVLCPNSLKGWWASEIRKWSQEDLPIIVVNSPDRKEILSEYDTGWVILNYEQVYRDPKLLRRIIWDWIICDESQRLKNRKTKTWRCVEHLKRRRMMMVTATPMGNDPSELWAQLHLLRPKRYSSFWRFFEMYVDYTEEWHGGRTIHGVRNPELLRRELSTIMFSRKKDEVASDLPEKQYQTIPLELTDDQKRLYRDVTKELLIKCDTGEIDIINEVSMVLRLRQIVSSPMAFLSGGKSCKVEAVLDFVDSTKEKVVVFTQFRATVEHISMELDRRDIGHVVLMGGFDPDEAKKEFQEDDECQVFVATTATGGVGLTLTAARNLIFVDKHWNPVQQKQAEDRIHRIGQDRNCHIIDLYCPGTVDALVEQVLQGKLQMNTDVFGKALYSHLEEWA